MSSHHRRQHTPTVRVCVVGAGPRGLSVVERICANGAGSGRHIVIHLVDPYVGRGGRVWSVEQSPLLLMNTIASQVSMFTDDSVECAGPILPGPSLYDWARTVAEEHPEARRLGPDSYPSRALYGHYLNWVLQRLCATAPSGVTIIQHPHTAVSLDELPVALAGTTPKQVVTLDNGLRLGSLDAVVLAQGHVDVAPDSEQRALSGAAAMRGLGFLPRANPAEADLSGITSDDVVAIRGMGLNFFDYMALLTSGRGGRYVREAGTLKYVPSGLEPRIYAGSRRGVPYHARGENEKGAFGRHESVFLTPAVISRMRDCAQRGRPVNFRREVWPLIARDVELVYYTALLRQSSTADAEAFAAEYVGTAPEAIDKLLDRFGVVERWDWAWIAAPQGDRGFGSPAEFRAWLLEHLRADHAHARRGNVTDPLKAALDVLRDLRNEVRLIVDHSGISGSSYRSELSSWYTPLNAYLSIGPPASRIEEMIALIEAGVLDVLGPGMRVEVSGFRFLASSPEVPGSAVSASVFIDARLPEFSLPETTDPLLAQLRERGECSPYLIPDSEGDYETGGLAVSTSPYQVLDGNGVAHPRRFGYGVPTEGVHWVTAAGIRPGVNSVILSDADAIARAALAIAGVYTGAVAQTA
jgi:hypothetical protein